MWLKLLVCLLAASASGRHSPAWNHNTEYVYRVHGRTLTGLDQNSNAYSGVFIKAQLAVRPKSDGNLGARISNLQYADFQNSLQEWDEDVPESELDYRTIPTSSGNMEIAMDNGVVRDLVVDSAVPNWEANMIKGIISQLQVDTAGENQIRSSVNMRVDGAVDAVFKTMEQTVSGEAETSYDIHPLPEYVLQTTPWVAPLRDSNSDEKLIEVVKTKNYTHSHESLAYHFGWEGIEDFDINNRIGSLFSRMSVNRLVLLGNMKNFTIQSSVTLDQVSVVPTLQDKQRGSTNSIVNVTLISIEQQNEEFDEVSNPVSVGLVYSYNNPFADTNGVQPTKLNPFGTNGLQSDHRSKQNGNLQLTSAESGSNPDAINENFNLVQEKPHIKEAPASPLLPLTVGYDGQSFGKKRNVQETVKNLAESIGSEFQQPDDIPEQNTVGKFIMLCSLVRVMDYDEIKDVADQLYTEEERGPAALAWVAYRDSVSESGTGPALLVIREWIQNGQISGEEAAQVVATAAESARQPTEKYARVLFAMVQNEEAMQQQHLNDSLLLSFANLVNQVYVNKRTSHNKYPVHSFGSFNTEEGRTFVENEVVPWLSGKLEEAVSRADTQRIHVYIRALGDVGHRKVLQVFKPYLEGTRKISQFQRVLMVVALDNLIRSDPVVARSVLFRLYQNPREYDQVRVAAVFQLVRCNPSPAMLQSMAAYTNIDISNNVNSAVKSIIETIATLEHPKFANLRQSAQSAKPLLTSQKFGIQNSKVFLLQYFAEETQTYVKQLVEMFSGEDSSVPKGLSYLLQGRFYGAKQQFLKMRWMVSSVSDLINVFERQTKTYRSLLKEKQAQDSSRTKWSSEYTAKLLNMQNEQREQLEGYMSLQVQAWNKILSLDNHTLDNLTNIVKQLETELMSRKSFNYNKMAIHPEIALSFPTAWGLPFIYTYDKPVLVHLESEVKAVANPQVSSAQGLQIPETVDVEYQLKGFISGRVQSQFGVFMPFNNMRYSAGYDKNFQVRSPAVHGKVLLDVRHRQITLEMETNEREDVNLLHFSTWPYTTQYQIHDFRPRTNIIKRNNPQRINTVLGEKLTGIPVALHVTSDESIDFGLLYEKIQEENLATLLSSWLDTNIQHTQIDLTINAARVTSGKMILHLGHQKKYTSGLSSNWEISEKPRSTYPISQESWERQKEFLKNSTKGIRSADAQVWDATVLFEGRRIIKYSATVADAKSKKDLKGRMLMQAEKDNQIDQPMKVYWRTLSQLPNTNSLNLDVAVDHDPQFTFEVIAGVQEKNQNPSEIQVSVKLSKSEDRKQHLKQQLQYRQCKRQMQSGNNQLPACASLTDQANLLNAFSVNIGYTNVDSALVNETYKLYGILRENLYPRISENILNKKSQSGSNQISLEGQFSPDLSTVNASVSTNYGQVEISNVPVNSWVRNILVLHPVYNANERMQNQFFNYGSYHPLCVVDQNFASTFDNKTFPINLDNDWVVLLHYIPRYPSSVRGQSELTVTEQLQQQLEGYIVYGRAYGSQNSQKEIKLVIQSPSTSGKVIDITVKPSDSSSHPRLFVQNNQILYNDQGPQPYEEYMQVYKLPNNELKLEIYDTLSLIYDGVRAKILLPNDKFRDAARGLCGTFTGEPETDFTHPGNCIIQRPDVFVAANTVPEKQRTKRMNDMLMIQAEEKKCYQKTVGYIQVVSQEDFGAQLGDAGVMRRTKYVKMGDEVCFSLLPVAVCEPGKRQLSLPRPVGVHCVKSSGVSDLWMRQVDQGININFAHKSQSREVLMKMAQRCE